MRDNVSSNGKLDNLAVTKALLTYGNTQDRDTGLSPTIMLLGRNPRDLLPTKPFLLRASDLSSTWQDVAGWRELALAKRSAKAQENLTHRFKEHANLELGDNVMVQNQERFGEHKTSVYSATRTNVNKSTLGTHNEN